MQVNPHMQGMMPMAPVSTMQGVVPPMMPQPMGHPGGPGQMPMMAYGQQQPQQAVVAPQQAYMPYHQPQVAAPMPGAIMQPPPPPPPMQMQPSPMEVQYMMQQQQQVLHHAQHQRSQHHMGGGGGSGGGGGGGQNPKGRVFIGNLNTNEISRSDLERIFSRYGALTEVNLHNGYAFVQFIDEPAARTACQREDGKVYAGQTIDVNIASEPKNRRDRHGGGMSASGIVGGGGSGVGGGGGGAGSVKDRLGPRRLPATGLSYDDKFESGSSGGKLGPMSSIVSAGGRPLPDRMIGGGRDYLVCGHCKDLFDSVERLTRHKGEGCRRRFICRCKSLGEPRTIDCAKCGRQFLSSWELLRHCQAEHEISVYANCVFASGGGGGGGGAGGSGGHEVATDAGRTGSAASAGELTGGSASGGGGGGGGGGAGDVSVESASASEELGGGSSGRRRRGEMEDDEDDEEEEGSGSEKSD